MKKLFNGVVMFFTNIIFAAISSFVQFVLKKLGKNIIVLQPNGEDTDSEETENSLLQQESFEEDFELLSYIEQIVGLLLKETKYQAYQTDLVNKMNISKSKVSIVLAGMKDEGLIIKIRYGKYNLIRLTEKGINFRRKNTSFSAKIPVSVKNNGTIPEKSEKLSGLEASIKELTKEVARLTEELAKKTEEAKNLLFANSETQKQVIEMQKKLTEANEKLQKTEESKSYIEKEINKLLIEIKERDMVIFDLKNNDPAKLLATFVLTEERRTMGSEQLEALKKTELDILGLNILRIILEVPGITQKLIAGKLNINKSIVNKYVALFVDRDWIEKKFLERSHSKELQPRRENIQKDLGELINTGLLSLTSKKEVSDFLRKDRPSGSVNKLNVEMIKNIFTKSSILVWRDFVEGAKEQGVDNGGTDLLSQIGPFERDGIIKCQRMAGVKIPLKISLGKV